MLNTIERIAVMGGTFNPIHYAHLLSAEQVRTGLGYDKILFIPSARPPHKVSDADIIGTRTPVPDGALGDRRKSDILKCHALNWIGQVRHILSRP